MSLNRKDFNREQNYHRNKAYDNQAGICLAVVSKYKVDMIQNDISEADVDCKGTPQTERHSENALI